MGRPNEQDSSTEGRNGSTWVSFLLAGDLRSTEERLRMPDKNCLPRSNLGITIASSLDDEAVDGIISSIRKGTGLLGFLVFFGFIAIL